MKKIVVIHLLCWMILSSLSAQVKFGLRGGVSSSSILTDELITITEGVEEYHIENSNARLGFHMGLISRIEFFNLYLQPELLYSNTGGEVKVTDVIENEVNFRDMTFNKIDIPVLVGTKIGPTRLQAGPVGSFIISEDANVLNRATYEENYKNMTIGFQVGGGIDLWMLAIDLKYEGNLSKLGDNVTIGDQDYDFDTRNPQWIFSVGIFF
ncbi:MAG: porin family protein [Bacteroidota bacterium]